MPTLQLEHSVRDFDRWKAAFDSDPVGRAAGGVRSYRVARLAEDPNYVLIELEFDTAAEADAFHEKLRVLWGERAADLGLESPRGRVVEIVESATL